MPAFVPKYQYDVFISYARSVSRYDFFIAYATPDRLLAQDLCWFLQDDACKVFLDVQDLSPGAVWPSALREALEASRAIVVLVSTHANDAFYQQEEIVRAIQLARDKPSAHTVIPVLLEKLPQGAVRMPYGMSSLQAQDATRPGGLKRVATELVAWLKDHQAKEWVRGFREKLQEHLDSELHQDKAASIFWDRNELDGDSPLTAAITQALSRTATLLIVLSKAYLDQPWCRRECESFFNEVGTSSRRAFVVLLEDVPKDEHPSEIQALEVTGFFKFWEQHPDIDKPGVNRPLPLDGNPFHGRICELAAAVAARLCDLKKDRSKDVQPVGAARSRLAGAKVFLADGISDPPDKDLEDARSAVRNWLTDQGAVVLPQESGSLYAAFCADRTQCESTFDELVKEDTIFVQLLGRKGDDKGYESWLCERAQAAGKVPDKDLLLWRSMSLTADSINSEKHRDLVFGQQYQVISCDISEFQPVLAKHIEAAAIERTLRASPDPTPDALQGQKCGLVLVDNDDSDARLADQLQLALEHLGIKYLSAFNDFNDFSQMALHDTVDGVVFTFGDCDPQWARKRYQATRLLWLNKKSRPCIGVLRGSPDRALLTNVDSIFVINANNPADIETFAQRVREVAK